MNNYYQLINVYCGQINVFIEEQIVNGFNLNFKYKVKIL